MIKLIKQPTWNTCTSACLAMLTGIPVEQVVDEYHDKYMDDEIDLVKHNPFTYLVGKGFMPILSGNPYDHRVLGGCVALITVPSQNIEGKLHHILYDNVDPDNRRLLDPSKKKTYDFETLESWRVDFSIVGHDLPSP